MKLPKRLRAAALVGLSMTALALPSLPGPGRGSGPGRRSPAEHPHHPHRRPAAGHDDGDAEDDEVLRQRGNELPERIGHDAAVLSLALHDLQRPLRPQPRGAHERGPDRTARRPDGHDPEVPARRRLPDRDRRQDAQQLGLPQQPPELGPLGAVQGRQQQHAGRRLLRLFVQRRRHSEDDPAATRPTSWAPRPSSS